MDRRSTSSRRSSLVLEGYWSWDSSFEESIRREEICGFSSQVERFWPWLAALRPVFLCIVDPLVLVAV